MTNLFYGKSIGGKLVFDNQKALSDYLLNVDTKPLLVKIDRERSKRSLAQNNYYWNYLRIIANETGHTEDELHQLFKRVFLPPIFKVVLGQEIKIPRTTSELSKTEFGEYLDRICARTNVPLPDTKVVSDLQEVEYPDNNLKPTTL